MYSSDVSEYGAVPNTNVSVISLGHPGTLPMVNKRAVEFAVKLGLAVHAEIREENQFARKNYFYADLPKGYQVTQDKTPICNGGFIEYKLEGEERKVNLTRIHMEEDAGKSLHDVDPFNTLVDLNRAGTPLLEIVTEPDLRNGEEAYAYLNEVRKLVRYLEICDGNMEEGSLRCDANISVRLKGASEFGRKVEVKNMNSFRNVQRAIDFEFKRQIDCIETGQTIDVETRSFDAVKGSTFSLRSKESANDYRYFPEPDLLPVYVTQEYVQKVSSEMPMLPVELFRLYVNEYGLSEYDAYQLTELKEEALFFNEIIKHTRNYKSAANWLMGTIRSYMNENAIHLSQLKVTPEHIAIIIGMIDEGKISNTAATTKLFPELNKRPQVNIQQLAEELDLIQNSDSSELLIFVEDVLKRFPEKVDEYKAGKKGLLGMFVGEVMKTTKGKADPKVLNQLVREKLEN